jgi:pimeloyl-ACP methyl ester carboxylesterase
MIEDVDTISYLDNGGNRIAYQTIPAAPDHAGPGVVFLPGFASDMTGSKALHLASKARAEGFAFTRMDYAGHGRSGGNFRDCTLATWLSDALAVFDTTLGPQIVVGSSMGGWLALHLALARPARIHAIIGIAAAPDFTQDLIWQNLSAAQRAHLEEVGFIELPSEYGAPQVITRALIESGRELLLLRGSIAIDRPVYLIHGLKDADVPWQTSIRISEAVTSGTVQIHLVKDGEHRLSRESDLALLDDVLKAASGCW